MIIEPSTAIFKTVMEAAKDVIVPNLKEASINFLKEGTRQCIQETGKEALKTKAQDYDYAQQYIENKWICEKLSVAKRNPEASRALLNLLDGSGAGSGPESKFKGTLNECERIADLKAFSDKVRKETKVGDNRVDIFCDPQKPIRLTGISFNERNGVYLKNFIIKPNQKFALECKDGDFIKYIRTDLPHILEQVKAGKELSGDTSLLQLTSKNFDDIKKLPIEEQKSFFQQVTDAGGKIIISETDPFVRILAIRKAMIMVE